MPIPPAHANRLVYHFTHIDNLPGLLQTGFLSNNHPNFPRNGHRSVAEGSIQCRRAEMQVTCGPGGVVHDYVPLYFGSVSLMLLSVLNKKNVDQHEIIYFEFPISLLNRNDVVFTDAAANTAIPPNFYSDPANLNLLNWAEIDSRKWKCANDTLKHQRMAEVLVHANLPLQDACQVVVWNDEIEQHIRSLVNAAGVQFPEIKFEDTRNHPHYFTKFMEGKPTESLVSGPKVIAGTYQSACETIANANHAQSAPFRTPLVLLEALREDFGCLPHTAELIGLKSANGLHKYTVDVHTLQVVIKLRALPEFGDLPDGDQDRLELAAYLHDIGKGPKARWANCGGVQQVDSDHPIRAIPMLTDILTNYVAKVKQENAELILKLVLYHDLVGDVLGKQRDEQQIVDVAQSELELAMLFALGKADATTLHEEWWDGTAAAALYARCATVINAR